MLKINKSFVAGAFLGFIAGIASRKIAEELGPALKPLSKEAIKAAKSLTAKLREGFGYFYETVSDISAEASSELDLSLLKKRKEKKAPKAENAEVAPDPVAEEIAV